MPTAKRNETKQTQNPWHKQLQKAAIHASFTLRFCVLFFFFCSCFSFDCFFLLSHCENFLNWQKHLNDEIRSTWKQCKRKHILPPIEKQQQWLKKEWKEGKKKKKTMKTDAKSEEKIEQRYIFVKQMNEKLYSFRVLSFAGCTESYTTETHRLNRDWIHK